MFGNKFRPMNKCRIKSPLLKRFVRNLEKAIREGKRKMFDDQRIFNSHSMPKDEAFRSRNNS